MQTFSLIGHQNGPGIAAGVILNVLMDELVSKNVLTHGDIARILASTDATLARWGETNAAVVDARRVVNKMRGLGA
jgi:hypothetical protein